MIKSYNPYVTFIIIAFGALIIMGIGVNLFLGGIKDPETVKKLSVYAKTTGFIIFLVIGFSAVPVMVKIFTDLLVQIMPEVSLTKGLRENAMTIVYVFWVIYLLGLGFALPAMQKAGFFAPELPEAFTGTATRQSITQPPMALPPLEYQIKFSKVILLATTQSKNSVTWYRIDEILKQDLPQPKFSTDTAVLLDTKMWELLGYKPVDASQTVFFFHEEGLAAMSPLEALPVENGAVRYGYGSGGDPTIQQTLTLKELKEKISSSSS